MFGMAAAATGLYLTFGTWLTSLELERALVDFFSVLVGSCFGLAGVDKNMRIAHVGLLVRGDIGIMKYRQRVAHKCHITRHHRSTSMNTCSGDWRGGRYSLRVHLQNASVAFHLRSQHSLETGSCS